MLEISEFTKYEYIDYIYGGMTLSLFMAIDFTAGNLSYKNTHSLHYLSENKIVHPCSDSEDESIVKKKKKISDLGNIKEQMLLQAILDQKKFEAKDTDNEY